MMKKLFVILFLGVFAGALTACSTIMRDGDQTIPVRANVNKVNIKIVNKAGKVVFEGRTPTTVNLKTSTGGYFDPEEYTVIASKDGYQTQTKVINWYVSGWYVIGNLVFGGLIGYLIVDPVSGHMYYLDEEVNLDMFPIEK